MKSASDVLLALCAAAFAALLSAPLAYAAPLPIGLPVTVNNTASNPVPITGAVGVTSLPSVTINSSTPVNVRDADNPARQPFQTTVFGQFDPSSGNPSQGGITVATVPSGKALIVETESCHVFVNSSNQFYDLSLEDGNPTTSSRAEFSIPLTLVGTANGGFTILDGLHTVHISAGAGHTVKVTWEVFQTDANPYGSSGFRCDIAGYFVNTP